MPYKLCLVLGWACVPKESKSIKIETWDTAYNILRYFDYLPYKLCLALGWACVPKESKSIKIETWDTVYNILRYFDYLQKQSSVITNSLGFIPHNEILQQQSVFEMSFGTLNESSSKFRLTPSNFIRTFERKQRTNFIEFRMRYFWAIL